MLRVLYKLRSSLLSTTVCFFYFLVRNDTKFITLERRNNVDGFGVHT